MKVNASAPAFDLSVDAPTTATARRARRSLSPAKGDYAMPAPESSKPTPPPAPRPGAGPDLEGPRQEQRSLFPMPDPTHNQSRECTSCQTYYLDHRPEIEAQLAAEREAAARLAAENARLKGALRGMLGYVRDINLLLPKTIELQDLEAELPRSTRYACQEASDALRAALGEAERP